jgi:DNA repair ATPase RecN
MNKATRKRLESIRETLANAQSDIESIRDEEQEKFDSLSEGLQQSEQGQNIEQASGALSNVADSIDTAVTELDEAISL